MVTNFVTKAKGNKERVMDRDIVLQKLEKERNKVMELERMNKNLRASLEWALSKIQEPLHDEGSDFGREYIHATSLLICDFTDSSIHPAKGANL